jgi:hypothetical protein
MIFPGQVAFVVTFCGISWKGAAPFFERFQRPKYYPPASRKTVKNRGSPFLVKIVARRAKIVRKKSDVFPLREWPVIWPDLFTSFTSLKAHASQYL